MAKESKERINQSGKFDNRRIVTEIKSASKFYKAEEYHQNTSKKADWHTKYFLQNILKLSRGHHIERVRCRIIEVLIWTSLACQWCLSRQSLQTIL